MLKHLGIIVDVFENGIRWLEIQEKKNLCLRNNFASRLALQKLDKLKKYDLFIISDTIGAFDNTLNISLLRRFDKPILFYEVFYLGGSKYWLDRLPQDCLNKFDAHLSVSHIHDSTPLSTENVHFIGLNLLPLVPFQRKNENEFVALLDFERKGYEKERLIYKRILKKLSLPYIELEGEYTFSEIEKIYSKVSVAFVSFPEAFGVPIAQLQNYGAYIVSPYKDWVKRHAILPQNAVFYDNLNPAFIDNFIFFDSEEELEQKLYNAKKSFNASEIQKRFLEGFPNYAIGNLNNLDRAVSKFI
jgi:hypothetical protein